MKYQVTNNYAAKVKKFKVLKYRLSAFKDEEVSNLGKIVQYGNLFEPEVISFSFFLPKSNKRNGYGSHQWSGR